MKWNYIELMELSLFNLKAKLWGKLINEKKKKKKETNETFHTNFPLICYFINSSPVLIPQENLGQYSCFLPNTTAGIFLKVNNGCIRIMCELCSQLRIKICIVLVHTFHRWVLNKKFLQKCYEGLPFISVFFNILQQLPRNIGRYK